MILFATNSKPQHTYNDNSNVGCKTQREKDRQIDRLTEALTKGVIKILRVEKKYVIIISKDHYRNPYFSGIIRL